MKKYQHTHRQHDETDENSIFHLWESEGWSLVSRVAYVVGPWGSERGDDSRRLTCEKYWTLVQIPATLWERSPSIFAMSRWTIKRETWKIPKLNESWTFPRCRTPTTIVRSWREHTPALLRVENVSWWWRRELTRGVKNSAEQSATTLWSSLYALIFFASFA